MSSLRDNIAGERKRLREIRQILSAAVAQGAGGDSSWVPFYIAIGNYFELAMHRLHVQDIRMGDMLRDKADLDSPNVIQGMSELDQRLEGNQKHLELFQAGWRALESKGDKALEQFEQAATDYTNFITSNMGHHGLTTDLARELFSPDDWVYMANISEEDAAREQENYAQVLAAMPENLELPGSE